MRVLKDIVLFLLVFSFINDNFIVEIAGENALKIIFIIFIVINIQDILRAFAMPKNIVIKSFYLFIFAMAVILFLDIMTEQLELIKGLEVLIPITIVFVYISYYQNLDKLLYFIWTAVVASAVISLFNEPVDQWTYRISGGTIDANEFSLHLLVGMSIGVYLYNRHKNILLFIVTSLLFFYALLYAGSKTAMLALILAILYTLYVKFRFILKGLFSVKVMLSLLIIIFALSQYDFGQMKAVEGLKQRAKSFGTAHERFISWKAGGRMIRDNFVTGVGVGNYEKKTRQYALDFIAKGSLAAHNLFINLFAETGIFPTVTFLIFLFFLLYVKHVEVINSQYFWLNIAVYTTLFMGLTLSITYEKYFWMVLALLSNVIMRLSFEEESNEEIQYENTPYIA